MELKPEDELLALSGLNPNSWECLAFAPALDDLPAIGTYKNIAGGSGFAFIRETPLGPVPGALASVSANPAIAFDLDRQDQERLNAEANAPNGADAPVGQEVALEAHKSARVGDRPLPEPVEEPIETVTGVIVTCPDCGEASGHLKNCMYYAPDPAALLDDEGWGG